MTRTGAPAAVSAVLAGGGTAGHVEPALALADALRRRGVAVSLLGTPRGLETRLVPARGHELDLVPPVPLPRRPTPALLRVPFALLGAVRAAARVLDARQADVVVGFGGYAALPAYLAARRRRVPVVVHEANVLPGLANRVGARFAAAVATAYPDTPLPGAKLVGTPLRPVLRDLDRAGLRARAAAELGLDPARPTLLAFGGSQGAARINAAVAGVLGEAQVLHVHGARNEPAGTAEGYVAVPYVDRMELAYAAADLALCRAGAMTVAELSAVGLPAVYVPLPHGNGEQRRNAAPVVAAGGALEVADADLTPAYVREVVLPLLHAPERLAEMAAKARGVGRPDADERLADLVLSVVR